MATNDVLYRGWEKAGLSAAAAAFVADTGLTVHGVLASPTVTQLNNEITAASNASAGGVPRVVEVSGTMTIDAPIALKDLAVVRCPAGQSLIVETSVAMTNMITFNGGYFQSRTCTLTGSFNSYNATITDPDTQLELGIWQLGGNSSNGPGGQIVEITEINGSTVTLSEPLVQDFTSIAMLTMNNGASDFINRAGLEGDITLRPLHDVTDLIYTRGAYDCWIQGVTVDGTTDDGIDGTGDGQLTSSIYLRQSYHMLIDDVLLDNARDHGDGGNGYGINFLSNTSASLASNCTINRLRHSVLFHAGCAGNVLRDSYTGDPIHPNFPNGGPTEVSFHGYCSANLVIGCDSGRIMLIDASQPGPNNCLAWNKSRTGPLTLDGTSTNQLTDTVLINNEVQGDINSLRDLYVPPLFDQPNTSAQQRGDINGWSPLRPFWYGNYNAGTVGDTTFNGETVAQPVGRYDQGAVSPDPFAAANGLPAGHYLPNPSQVDLASITVDTTSQPGDASLTWLSWYTAPGGGGGAAGPITDRTLEHFQGDDNDQNKTVPLSAHAGDNRHALLIVGWQGAQNGAADMGTDFGPLGEGMRVERNSDFVPGIAVYYGPIPTGTADLEIPTTANGGGWNLYVFEGGPLDDIDIGTVTSNTDGDTYQVRGAGVDGTVIGTVVTNANTTVNLSGGLTKNGSNRVWYGEPVSGHATPGIDGTMSFGTTAMRAVTVTVPKPEIAYAWTMVSSGTATDDDIVGQGIGTDVNSTDINGITDDVGEPLDVEVVYDVTPEMPPAGYRKAFQARCLLSPGHPVESGYRYTAQLFDGNDTPISAEVEIGTLIGGEQSGVFDFELEIT